jgi:NitT/TauT family transport system substrate-binding protein
MAQGIAASDQVLKEKPELVHRFVKAALHGMKDIMNDPGTAADDFVKFVPEWKGKEGAIKATLVYYATLVYPGQRQLGNHSWEFHCSTEMGTAVRMGHNHTKFATTNPR